MIIWALNSLCTALLIVLRRKCQSCQQQAGKQIVTALDKMSKGDLDWKLTLHRNTELAEVADSVNKAQELLTQRISSLQLKTREISEVEDFLFDSIQCDKSFRPHTLKALRKLKICLSRLKLDVDDFELSLNSENKEYSKTVPFV
jgi:methyl-accepting chemotaxis protein